MCAYDVVQMAEHKDKLAAAGWHVLVEATELAEMEYDCAVSIILPEEARVSELVAHLVNACGVSRVSYSNRAP